jgi:hypothetical protein
LRGCCGSFYFGPTGARKTGGTGRNGAADLPKLGPSLSCSPATVTRPSELGAEFALSTDVALSWRVLIERRMVARSWAFKQSKLLSLTPLTRVSMHSSTAGSLAEGLAVGSSAWTGPARARQSATRQGRIMVFLQSPNNRKRRYQRPRFRKVLPIAG